MFCRDINYQLKLRVLRPQTSVPSSRTKLQVVADPNSKNWLAEMLVVARTMAIGAELIPMPYVRAAFGTVLLFLEAVDRIKRNREGLKDLCGSMLEIMMILREETKAHGTNINDPPTRIAVKFFGTFYYYLPFVPDGNAPQLITTINTHLNVIGIHQTIAVPEASAFELGVRKVALGDINLLYDTAIRSKTNRVKILIARISGEPSTMTVAQYEDAENSYLYQSTARITDPNLTSFGHVLKRCSSKVSHAATICVKREPVGICLTLPGSDIKWDVNPRERLLSHWHSSYFCHRTAPSGISPSSFACAPQPKDFASTLTWEQFLAMLTPAWLPRIGEWNTEPQFFLGSIVPGQHLDGYLRPMLPVADLDNSSPPCLRQWTLGPPPKSSPSDPYDGKTHSQWQRYIEFDPVNATRLNLSWLAQANACISPALLHGEQPHEGTPQETHAFVCPITVKYEGSRIGVEDLQSDCYYWSLDASGSCRLSTEECDFLGIPRLRVYPICGANYWHRYHYNAICEFARSKGVHPDSQDVAQLLSLPKVQMRSSGRGWRGRQLHQENDKNPFAPFSASKSRRRSKKVQEVAESAEVLLHLLKGGAEGRWKQVSELITNCSEVRALVSYVELMQDGFG
ncbi:hypothetical protein GGX14DRAFT_400387 [Mycena pura]|uniref:Uncharacterized protein n=1 Tax=Mycena pura TaxID=153505 RepID=A0AAD6V9G2_9AGAR|nr:hypothetical protein GGX14DRAFT_400387 [Mycena pura]